jgi:hypothetical protein
MLQASEFAGRESGDTPRETTLARSTSHFARHAIELVGRGSRDVLRGHDLVGFVVFAVSYDERGHS